jgi:hypothetical protein
VRYPEAVDQRGPVLTRPAPGSFRCLVCQEYVRGTDTGHCPKCAYVPPSAPPAQEPPGVWSAMMLVHVAIILVAVIVLVQLI